MACVLVVEDTLPSLQYAVIVLEKRGHRVLTAERAEAALEMAPRELPDVILMDMQLPGMDGLAATRLLKSDPRTVSIPVVAVTALAMVGDRERILAAGCDDYLTKPYHHHELVAVIDRVLARRG